MWAVRNKSKALRHACYEGKLPEVKTHVLHGADLNTSGFSGNTPLHRASFAGHEPVVDYLLKHGATPNCQNKDRDTPLHLACKEGHAGVVALLVGGGATPGIPNANKENALDVAEKNGNDACYAILNESRPTEQLALYLASHHGNTYDAAALAHAVDHVTELLDAGAQLRHCFGDDEDLTLLHMACASGFIRIVELLINYGADICARTKEDKTPFHLACAAGHSEVARLLCDHKADTNAMDEDGLTPFLLACTKDVSGDLVQMLMNHGAKIHSTTFKGRTALHLAAVAGMTSVAAILIHKGLRWSAKCQEGYTPLHCAADHGEYDVALLLLHQRGADANVKTVNGTTPLMISDDSRVAELLLDNGAQVNARTNKEVTALHFAAVNDHPDVAKLLIDRHADINARDEDGDTPLHATAGKDAKDVARLLIDRGADINAQNDTYITPLHIAAAKNSTGVVELLLARGADLHVQELGAKSMPLHQASVGGAVEAVRLLVEYGARIDAVCADDDQTALHLAAKMGHAQVATILLSSGAGVNVSDNTGWTAVHYAAKAETGGEEMLRLLIEFPVNVNAKTNKDQTALHIASSRGDTEMVKMLLVSHAAVDFADEDKWTALHFAALSGHREVTEELLKAGASRELRTSTDETAEGFARRAGHHELAEFISGYEHPAATRGRFFDTLEEMERCQGTVAFIHKLEELAGLVSDVHEMRIFYTLLSSCVRCQFLLKADIAGILTKALDATSRTCTNETAVVIFRNVLRKATRDGFVDQHDADRFDHRALMAQIPHASFFKEIWDAINDNSARMHVIEHNVEGLQDSFHLLQENILLVSDQVQAITNYLETKKRIDCMVGLIGAFASAFSMGVGGSLVSSISTITNRLVDFGDLVHLREVLEAVAGEDESAAGVLDKFNRGLEAVGNGVSNRMVDQLIVNGDLITRITLIAAAQRPLMRSPPTGDEESFGNVSGGSPTTVVPDAVFADDESLINESGGSPGLVFPDAVFADDEKNFPVHAAVKYGYLEDILVAADENPTLLNAKDARRQTALDMAALTGQTDVIEQLKAKGATFTMKSKMRHESKLRAPRAHDYLDEVRRALGSGVFPTLNDDDEENFPLHAAVKYADMEDIEEALAENLDDLNEVDSAGRTALDFAALTGQFRACELFEKEGGHYELGGKWKMRAMARSRGVEDSAAALNA